MKSTAIRLLFTAFVAAAAVAFTGAPVFAAADAPKRPNIVFVLVDDMGYRDLGCFGGVTGGKTPHIDRLAAEGLRFNQFYVNSPICSPSRVAFTTGQYPNRWRVTSFLSNRKENKERGIRDWLDPSAPTLARFLKDAGYHTAHVGKWHMGGQRDVADAPPITAYGFDVSLTNFEGLGPRVLAKFEKGGHGPTDTSAKFGGPGVEWDKRENVTGRYVDRAIQEMDGASGKKQPFYVNLWLDDVHSPWEPSAASRGDGSPEALYLGALNEMDRTLGRLFDHIRSKPELRDNTIVLLASDNGHEGGRKGGGSLRGNKGNLYEGGIRSPLIAWGPGVLDKSAKPGSSNDRTVIAGMDFAPTLLAIAGTQAPTTVRFDGADMSGAVLGKAAEPRPTPVMWLRPPDRGGRPRQPLPDLAIREGDWKLLVARDGSRAELFNVVKDPDEKNNVAKENPDVTKRLSDAVIAWDKATTVHAPKEGAK